jgi:hypothetical protein
LTGLLSAISGQFTKSLILGALFPAAVFVFLWLAVVAPLFPPDLVLQVPKILGVEWGVLSVTLATLLVAGLLYNLDVPLIRLYEGYSWRESWIGKWRTQAWRSKFDEEQKLHAVLFELTGEKGIADADELLSKWGDVKVRLTKFPDSGDLVLPTRLGNVVRAFERYPSTQYEIDAIAFWPRLISVLPSGYSSAIDDARTSFVFLLNLAYITAVLAVTTLAAGLFHLPSDLLQGVFLPTFVFGLSSHRFYVLAVGAAASWGDMVKGAFDLYRWELLKQLGYEQRPLTRADERKLWKQITQQVLFGDKQVDLKRAVPRVDYADPPVSSLERTAVSADTQDIKLQLSRGVQTLASEWKQQVVLSVQNADGQHREAKNVVVTEILPAGVEYEWGSATVDGQAVRPVGINPYTFVLGDLPSQASATLRFTIVLPSPVGTNVPNGNPPGVSTGL